MTTPPIKQEAPSKAITVTVFLFVTALVVAVYAFFPLWNWSKQVIDSMPTGISTTTYDR